MKTILTSAALIYAFFWIAITLEDAITPFFIAGLLAYILRPLVHHTAAKLHINRTSVITFVVFLLIFFIIASSMIFIPLVSKQISLLISKIPAYKDYIQESLLPDMTKKLGHFAPDFITKIDHAIDNLLGNMAQTTTNIVNHLFDYTSSLANILMILFLIPILLFYFLRDWPKERLVLEIFSKGVQSKIQQLLSDIDTLLSAYMRGQLKVCAIMSIYYSTTLYFVGLDLALLLGIISGFVIILPFLGFFFAFILALIFGYFNFGFDIHLTYIAIIYAIGSVLEGSILTPKIVGDNIGIHPLWIIFAVLAFGNLFGIIGMLFAIPIAGITKILLKLLLDIYKTKNKKNASI